MEGFAGHGNAFPSPCCVAVVFTGVVEAGVGMVAGGLIGAVLFKSGSGYRSASVAVGAGVAIGSTFERIRKSYY